VKLCDAASWWRCKEDERVWPVDILYRTVEIMLGIYAVCQGAQDGTKGDVELEGQQEQPGRSYLVAGGCTCTPKVQKSSYSNQIFTI
jgi:hypothetical protein